MVSVLSTDSGQDPASFLPPSDSEAFCLNVFCSNKSNTYLLDPNNSIVDLKFVITTIEDFIKSCLIEFISYNTDRQIQY